MPFQKIKTPNFIDLFAGCGGLSLGLELAGFSPVYVNELDKHAMETYLVNRESKYPHLRDNRFHSHDLTKHTNKRYLEKLKDDLKRELGISEIDLICGGPPCQGYSGIGLRRSHTIEKEDVPSNHLFKSMVTFIKNIKPKIFLFENVEGLIRSRWTKEGEKGEIFKSVLTAFNSIPNYEVTWDLIYSKDYGVPQRRPRVFIVGIRKDKVSTKLDNTKSAISNKTLPEGNIAAPSVEELLADILDENYQNGGASLVYPHAIQNKTQRFFRTLPDGSTLKKGSVLHEHEYSNHSQKVIERFASIIKNQGKIDPKFKNKKFSQRLLPKLWNESGPNITITSMPDDYVHYSQPRSPTLRECARFQTFPDWYKFVGKRTTGGKRRAGDPSANNFDRELPKFTQIGNAVPVLLGKAIGMHFAKLLKDVN